VSDWATLVERLIATGHADPWEYTPTQAMAYAELAERRTARAHGDAYTIQRNAVAVAMGALKKEDEQKFLDALDPED
jgi:hypothetical protein